jgi:hypothetical protein
MTAAAAPPSLERVQRWMQDCIQTPGELPERQQGVVRSRIKPSQTLTPEERLQIYRSMYWLRLVDALRVDYPGLEEHLGPERFEELARLYVEHYPSRSYTLNRLGDSLPEFVAQVKGLPAPGFCVALARLELVETQVFDAAETQPVNGDAFGRVKNWGAARFRFVDALRLVELSHPAQEFIFAMRRNEDCATPRRRRTWLAVHRRGYAVQHHTLEKAEAQLLTALLAGERLEDALASSGKVSEQRLYQWFANWVAAGFIAGLSA